MKQISFFIWGAGKFGKRAGGFFGDVVEAYIDNNSKLYGTSLWGKPIISFEEYMSSYEGRGVILVSNKQYKEIKRFLDLHQIKNYTLLGDCPSEVMYNQNLELVIDFLQSLLNHTSFAIYGLNAYGLWLYRWLTEKGKQVYIVDNPNDGSDVDKKKLSQSLDGYVLVKENVSDDVEVIVGASHGDGIKNERFIDCFYFYKQFDVYQNKEIVSYKNKYQGKRCFIVATGPSLKMEDLELLWNRREYSCGMNKVFLLFDKTQWRPNFYFVSDPIIIQDYAQEIRDCEIKSKFVVDSVEPFWQEEMKDNIIQCHGVRGGSKEDIFCEELDRGVSANYTVTYVCIQFAVYMGFKEIYLIGVDHSYANQINDAKNHVYGDRDVKAKFIPYRDSYMENSEKSYRAAKKYADEHGVKIINATRGGKLEVFERVDFDTLFD